LIGLAEQLGEDGKDRCEFFDLGQTQMRASWKHTATWRQAYSRTPSPRRIAMPDEVSEKTPDLSISPEKVCYIIAKAREFDAKDVVTDPDDASNPADDAMISVLEDHRDDPVVQEIAAAIFGMTEDEQIDLVALAWLGRGDGSIEDWNELRAEAARAHNKRTASYLLGTPLLADYLNEALSQFGHSCDD
jgi:Protein of unknown function (DUF3775)